MRNSLLLILCIGLTGIGLTGCATTQDRVAPVVQTAPRYYEPAAAAALAFDPPMASYGPLPSFSRDGRSPAAFYGYEQQSVDSLQIYQRDAQRGAGYPDYFDRTTHSGRSSVTYR